jgi:curved DNA-binding protein CbpA
MMADPYAVLGVAPTSTQAEITHAYRRHLRDYHPDLRSPEPNAPADDRLREILTAYALLRDPARRAAYDRAHQGNHDAGATRIDVTHTKRVDSGPDLWAGPVHWHR